MNKNQKESLNRVKGESFYTSPPYNYRPSLVEYLTTGNVTSKGFISSIMHMYHKGNLKIKQFSKDSIIIKLLSSDNLDYDELIIWNYLTSLQQNNEVKMNLRIPHKILSYFSRIVKIKTSIKFNSGLLKDSREQEAYNPKKFQFNQNILKFIYGILMSIGIVALIFFIQGIFKLLKYPKDISFFASNFIWKYIKIISSYYIFLIGGLILFSVIIKRYLFLSKEISLFFIGLYIILFILFFIKMSSFSYDYFNWIFESELAAKHRRDWLNFKSFVIKRSEIEKQPLSHYILWGPFYYYTLAVGGIKRYNQKRRF